MMTHAVAWFSAAEVPSESLSTWSEGLTRTNNQPTTSVVNTDDDEKCQKQVTPLQ